MLVSPYKGEQTYTNHLDDFKMPYRYYGKTDYEVMKHRYLKLNNNSYGYIRRFTAQPR